MIIAPLLLAILLCDLVGLLLLLTAVVQTVGVLDHWRPASNHRRQLLLERHVEMAGLYNGLTLGCFALGGLLLVVAICNDLPALVPGAMCGTGVLEAAGLPGWRALALRLLALLLLGAAKLISDLNQDTLTAPLATPLVKTLLLALPICGWTFWDTAGAFLVLNTHDPVSCCAVVYDRALPAAGSVDLLGLPDFLPRPLQVGLLAMMSLLILGCAGYGIGHQRALPLLLATAMWLPLAAAILLTRFAPYHFQVLAHQCPWCLFLPEHGLVGYPLLAAFLVMGMEAPLPLLARQLAQRYPACTAAASRRAAATGRRLLLALAVFWLVGGGPVLLWRLRYGVWIGG
ncbi:MAG: hypothetical protein QNJ22_05615 [Desulfosarcinaceae bacterium]|nr:hypothetical protein [Desulfosarcinaceae bacterium]